MSTETIKKNRRKEYNNNHDLTYVLQTKYDLEEDLARRIIDDIFETIIEKVEDEKIGLIKIRNFGTFKKTYYNKKLAHDPRINKVIMVTPRTKITFKCAKRLVIKGDEKNE